MASVDYFCSVCEFSSFSGKVTVGLKFSIKVPSRILENGSSCRRLVRFELNLFLIALSVLPETSFAMSHHLFPWIRWSLTILMSSSMVHFLLLMFGSRWLCHRSLHYLPIRPGSALDIFVQFRGPCSVTRSIRILSSGKVQVPVTQWVTSLSSSHRVWHLISDFPGISLLTLFQELLPNWLTNVSSFLS